jgi:hypothetical protein
MTSEWVINRKTANGVQANEFRVSTAADALRDCEY